MGDVKISCNAKIVTLFAGVSCDSCMKANFKGRRYKCLVCYDYDLCATCYESGVTTGRHSTDHPMQCILTRADFGKLRFLTEPTLNSNTVCM